MKLNIYLFWVRSMYVSLTAMILHDRQDKRCPLRVITYENYVQREKQTHHIVTESEICIV